MKFNELIEKSLKASGSKEYFCNLNIAVEGEIWKAYSASVAHRDILLFCDKGTATFLVDSYGLRNTAELFDWNRE